jgi:hypothetical protein
VETLKRWWNIALDAFWKFNADDGWAIASHIALSGLMSLFPFFLVLTAVAGIIGSTDLASEAARLVLEAWPEQVSGPIALEIQHVLEGAQQASADGRRRARPVLRLERRRKRAHRLNRAYSVVDTRTMWLLRLESIGYVILRPGLGARVVIPGAVRSAHYPRGLEIHFRPSSRRSFRPMFRIICPTTSPRCRTSTTP